MLGSPVRFSFRFDFELCHRHSMVRSRQVAMTALEDSIRGYRCSTRYLPIMPWELVDFQLSSNPIKGTNLSIHVVLRRFSFRFSFLLSFELPFKVEQKREPKGEHFVLFSVLLHRKRPQVCQSQTSLAAFVIACVCLDPGCRVRHSGLIRKSLISRFRLSLAACCHLLSPGSEMKRISRFRLRYHLLTATSLFIRRRDAEDLSLPSSPPILTGSGLKSVSRRHFWQRSS